MWTATTRKQFARAGIAFRHPHCFSINAMQRRADFVRVVFNGVAGNAPFEDFFALGRIAISKGCGCKAKTEKTETEKDKTDDLA